MAVAFSAILLSLPFARNPHIEWTFMDAVFTAASAISVTGLTTVNISETFTMSGYFLLMFVLQIGGIGIMALSTFFWLLFGRKIGLKQRQLIKTDQNQNNLAGLVSMLKQIAYLIFIIQAIGAIVLGTYYLKFFPNWEEAYLQGLFASVSATTNAGFDITGQSLIPFAHDYFVQGMTMVLIIIGAIGFPVWIEVKNFFQHRDKKVKFRFSLFTKMTTLTYFSLLLVGALFIYLSEYRFFFIDKSWHESFFYALFQSTTMRSAGLLTMDMNEFTTPTILILSTLMFIGASPNSVGGGIRTTTFALNLLFLFHFARGNTAIKVFNREIHPEDLMKSLVVLLLAITLTGTSIVLLSITEDASLIAIIFEVASAFGTCGASMGITSQLSTFGKSLIILLMFIGRIGILSFLLVVSNNKKEPNFHYPKERIIIG